jgi:hypothetical protein
MLSRREVIAGGVVGSLAASSGAAAEGAAQDPGERAVLQQIEDRLDEIGSSIDQAFNTLSLSVGPIGQLRKVYEQFLRSNGKFPDFCEVGAHVFYDVYDWHIRNRQPLTVMRQPDNRYTIQFMFTTLILKFENQVDFIGYPFDKV